MSERPAKVSAVPIVTVLAVLAIIGGWLVMIGKNTEPIPERMPKKFLLPAGFEREIVMHYGVEGADPLPEEDGYRVIEVPLNGRVETSSRIQWGRAVDEFYRDLLQPGPDGETTERLNFGHVKIHKSGLRGDENEFFEKLEELESRDPAIVARYEENKDKATEMMTAGDYNVGLPAYELIQIRSDL